MVWHSGFRFRYIQAFTAPPLIIAEQLKQR
jgi:hypothetical protein